MMLELDKLRKALPACEAFIDEYLGKGQQVEVRLGNKLRDDQVLAIRVDSKTRKHLKTISGVVVDGGTRVNVMSKHTRKSLRITRMKSAPFRVRMPDQQAMHPLGLVEYVEMIIEGTRFEDSFLILDVGTSYSMLLG